MRLPLLAWLLACAPCQGAPPPPNVLLVVLDDVGVDKVGAYTPAGAPPTPTLDRLAAEGVRFTQAYANPTCSPSRATLLTGQYARRNGVGEALARGGRAGMRHKLTTLPELLDGVYDHAAIGKWHLGTRGTGGDDHPNLAGFSHFAGSLHNFTHTNADGSKEGYYHWMRTVNGVTAQSDRYATEVTVDDALDWLEHAEPPWFLYLSFNAAHSPAHVPPPGTHSVADLSPDHSRGVRYDAVVESVDHALGRFLERVPQLDRTVVLVAGDNGTPDFGVSLPTLDRTQAKGGLMEGGIHVPMIAWGHGVTGGRAVDGLVLLTDVFPTVAELTGTPIEPAVAAEIDGVSFAQVLSDARATPARAVGYVDRFALNSKNELKRYAVAVFDGVHKVIRKQSADDSWYTLTADGIEGPDERATAADPAPFEALTAWLDELERTVPLPPAADHE